MTSPLRSGPRAARLAVRPLEDRTTPAALQGTLFEDLNANGAPDATEAGLEGVTVYLDANRNNLFDAGEATAVTGGGGTYTLPVPGPGTYQVGQVVPTGWVQTGPATAPVTGVFGDVLIDFPTPVPGVPAGGGNQYVGLAWANGSLYAAQGDTGTAPNTMYKLDPVTGAWSHPVTLPGQVIEFAFDPTTDTFWGADVAADALIPFDFAGGELEGRRIMLPGVNVVGVEWDGDSLWVLDNAADKIHDVNPATGVIVHTINAPDSNALGVAFDGRHLWVSGTDTDRLYEVNPADGAVLRTLAVADGFPFGLAFDGRGLWLGDHTHSRIVQYDLGVAPGRDVAVGGTDVSGVDFGTFRLGAAAGQVYQDLNGDGQMGAGEPGLEGWRVFLDRDGDGQRDPWERAVLTDGTGAYTLGSLRPGGYTVGAELRQPGWQRAAPAAGTRTGTIGQSGQVDTGGDFGHRLVGVGPVGTEFRVNATTAGGQGQLASVSGEGQVQSVVSDAQGNFLVVWEGNGPGDTEGVFAQRYDRLGNKVGVEFRVNLGTANGQRGPAAAMDASGNFVVAWSTFDPAVSNHAVFVRAFNANGTPRTGDVQVTAFSTKSTRFATSVAVDADGDFVVLFLGSDNKGFFDNGGLIFFQRYNAQGVPQGKITQVADAGLINGSAAVGMDATGNFVVTWSDDRVYAQRYDRAGRKLGGQITSAVGYVRPSLARAADGTFVIGSGGQIQVFNADGTPRSGAVGFGGTAGDGNRPALAIDADGVVVAWQGDGSEVLARRFTLQGAPVEGAFPVATTQSGAQTRPSVTMTGSGGFVVTWSGNGTGDDAGVFAQRYSTQALLTAAGGAAAGPAAPLTDAQLRPIVREAVRRWNLTGLTAAERKLLRSVRFDIADLDGATLGLAAGTTVALDRDGAGHGWFVDRTPRRDTEFTTAGDQGEQGKMDLLTAVVHELGHVLGREHAADGVMGEELAVGTRQSPAVTTPD